MKRVIIEAPAFTTKLRKLISKNKLRVDDFEDFKRNLIENPEMGDLVIGTGGIRKARLKSPSGGKSGGFRICYFFYLRNEELFFLLLYAKNEQENLTASQKQDLKNLTKKIKEK